MQEYAGYHFAGGHFYLLDVGDGEKQRTRTVFRNSGARLVANTNDAPQDAYEVLLSHILKALSPTTAEQIVIDTRKYHIKHHSGPGYTLTMDGHSSVLSTKYLYKSKRDANESSFFRSIFSPVRQTTQSQRRAYQTAA